MGIRTFAQMKTELGLKLGNRTDLGTRIDLWINAAYLEVATRYFFHELYTSVQPSVLALSNVTALPTDIHSILSVRDVTNGKKLTQTHWRKIDDEVLVYTKPDRYARYGSTLLVVPGCEIATTLFLRYYKRPDPMAADEDMAQTPSEWDEVIEQGAFWRALRGLLEPERAEAERREHLRLINSMPLPELLEDADAGVENTFSPRFS